jgi:hypothetical protein
VCALAPPPLFMARTARWWARHEMVRNAPQTAPRRLRVSLGGRAVAHRRTSASFTAEDVSTALVWSPTLVCRVCKNIRMRQM